VNATIQYIYPDTRRNASYVDFVHW